MVNKIEQDHQRFRQIVRGRIRKDLREFLSRGELIGREGKIVHQKSGAMDHAEYEAIVKKAI